MLRNYYKIVLRNLWRYKSYTLINIVGMAIGIAAMVWGYQTYRYSFSYDNFHPDRDNVYRALTRKDGSDGLKGIFPMAVLEAAKNLPLPERLELLDALWESIVEEGYEPSLTPTQEEEIDRRLEAHKKNPHDVVDWNTIKAELDSRFSKS